jgi:hypothetical protein
MMCGILASAASCGLPALDGYSAEAGAEKISVYYQLWR